ncbi:TetR/AcrR family transcriptional regulator [Leucobacter komagatae]|uniref:TetR/AcrR family transcriptional regulator n=1 Tax=Leucobacter komagatae TaxID=55969 RepID=UPI000698440F|nr:TetR/AcrR family transcriptional regulator [Leucobacter komagatae]
MQTDSGEGACEPEGARATSDGNLFFGESGPSTDEGIRQRRNRETRQRIHSCAVELAERSGIAAVTVAEIAEAAGISRRSFFRYFKCKEAAVLAGHSRYLDAAATLPLEVRSLGDALEAIERIGDVVLVQEGPPDPHEHRRINWLINHDPAIRSYAVAQDRVVADLFRDRLSAALPDESVAAVELAADLGVTVWRHGWIRWSTQAEAAFAASGSGQLAGAAGETPAESHRAVRVLFTELARSVPR